MIDYTSVEILYYM